MMFPHPKHPKKKHQLWFLVYKINELISLIKNASFIIANDTGPAHICSHMNKSGLVLFGGHTSAHKVSIGSEKFKSISVKNLNLLKTETVMEEIKKELH